MTEEEFRTGKKPELQKQIARTNDLHVEIKPSFDDAPNYNTDGQGFNFATLDKALIIRKGTVEGRDTIDLQFTDAAGKKHVAMITGRLIQQLASMINVHEWPQA